MKELLTPMDVIGLEEAAMILGVDESDVRNLVDMGDLTPIVDEPLSFDGADVHQMAEESKKQRELFIEFIHAGEDMYLDETQGVS